MTFGEKIKKLRNENQMTQEELAEKILVTRTAVSKWETDKGYPSIDSLKLLSNLFHISIDELISDDDVENKRLLEEKRAKTFYKIAVIFLGISVLATLINYFCPMTFLWVISFLGVIGYIVTAIFAKPKYKRAESKKYFLTYVISRLFILILVIGLMVSTIVTIS